MDERTSKTEAARLALFDHLAVGANPCVWSCLGDRSLPMKVELPLSGCVPSLGLPVKFLGEGPSAAGGRAALAGVSPPAAALAAPMKVPLPHNKHRQAFGPEEAEHLAPADFTRVGRQLSQASTCVSEGDGAPAEAAPAPAFPECTTVVVMNIPYTYPTSKLQADIEIEGLRYDYFHLPNDTRRKRNRGFAFINFTSPFAAHRFYQRFHGRVLYYPGARERSIVVMPSAVQGLERNMALHPSAAVGPAPRRERQPQSTAAGSRLCLRRGSQGDGPDFPQERQPQSTAAGSRLCLRRGSQGDGPDFPQAPLSATGNSGNSSASSRWPEVIMRFEV